MVHQGGVGQGEAEPGVVGEGEHREQDQPAPYGGVAGVQGKAQGAIACRNDRSGRGELDGETAALQAEGCGAFQDLARGGGTEGGDADQLGRPAAALGGDRQVGGRGQEHRLRQAGPVGPERGLLLYEHRQRLESVGAGGDKARIQAVRAIAGRCQGDGRRAAQRAQVGGDAGDAGALLERRGADQGADPGRLAGGEGVGGSLQPESGAHRMKPALALDDADLLVGRDVFHHLRPARWPADLHGVHPGVAP